MGVFYTGSSATEPRGPGPIRLSMTTWSQRDRLVGLAPTVLDLHALDRNNGTRELSRTSNFSLLFLFSTTMKRSTTHNYDNNKLYDQFETPRKAKIQGAIEFYEKQGIEYFKNDIFRIFNISYTRGYQYFQNLDSDYEINDKDVRKAQNSIKKDNRGPLPLIIPKDIREIKRII